MHLVCPARTILAMILIQSVGGCWVLEQPSSSLVFRLPKFQLLLKLTRAAQHCWLSYETLD